MQEEAGNVAQPHGEGSPAAEEFLPNLWIAFISGGLQEEHDRLSQRALNLLLRAPLDGDVEREADRLPLAWPPPWRSTRAA
jgi:hypothetical protein